MTIRQRLNKVAERRVLVLDGPIGSFIQRFKLSENDFRGDRFRNHQRPVRGCTDLLSLTKPGIVASIHQAYLRAGADIIKTNTFTANSISLEDYGLASLSYEICITAARLARESVELYQTRERPRFVVGIVGPSSKSASISPDLEDPGARSISWEKLTAVYRENVRGLLDGGVDLLMIETVFDSLNAKAAIFAIKALFDERHQAAAKAGLDYDEPPLLISGTIVDAAGRTLAGQTVEAFCVSMLHADPWSLGLNCSLGAQKLKPHLEKLAAFCPCPVSVHPNAGLPNRFGGYDESPESMAAVIESFLAAGLVNIVGGCCGSTPAHIAAIARVASKYRPRPLPEPMKRSWLAGLEPLALDRGFITVGERTNVAGSQKFLRLIKNGRYDEACTVARTMVEAGADVIDVCMDDALLDAGQAMTRFLNTCLSDPEIARLPVMVDSSRWEVIEAGLRCLQGKGLVNSISLKEGEAEFLRRAALTRRYGAAIVVMLFDEQGQADSYERKIAVAEQAYRLLMGIGFPAEDIVFDPNILTVATGIANHDRYALDFIRACSWIKANCPGVGLSGGLSNLSFSFRGHDKIREVLHAVFLKQAITAGLSMAIVNPATLISSDELEAELRTLAEDVVLARHQEAAERLLAKALELKAIAAAGTNGSKTDDKNLEANRPNQAWRQLDVEARLIHALIKGIDSYIEDDVLELRSRYSHSFEIIAGPLMLGINEVGDRFGAGLMFLPQVIKSARVMKKAVAVLEPFIQAEKAAVKGLTPNDIEPPGKVLPIAPANGQVIPNGTAKEAAVFTKTGTVVLATVRGDVHDIGKNIVAIVLACNGFTVHDLGVMVNSEAIIEAARREKADIIGLSGLITPSLDEMAHVARALNHQGFSIPLLIGGATTSLTHTALRLATEYSGPVVYVKDAGRAAGVVRALLSKDEKPGFLEKLETDYHAAILKHSAAAEKRQLLSLEAARANRVAIDWSVYQPPKPASEAVIVYDDYDLDRLLPYINWSAFFRAWQLSGGVTAALGTDEKGAEARQVYADAQGLLDRIIQEGLLSARAVVGIFQAASEGDDILLQKRLTGRSEAESPRFCFPRNQTRKQAGGPNACLADFIAPLESEKTDWIGLFALTTGIGLAELKAGFQAAMDDYNAILAQTLADRLAEAFSEALHEQVRQTIWGYASRENYPPTELFKGRYRGIRPAFGYPACPDHEDKRLAFQLLEAERIGIKLTETAMMTPVSSICGLYLTHPAAFNFSVGELASDQLTDWAKRKGLSQTEAARRLAYSAI